MEFSHPRWGTGESQSSPQTPQGTGQQLCMEHSSSKERVYTQLISFTHKKPSPFGASVRDAGDKLR